MATLEETEHDVTKTQPLWPYLNLAISGHHGYHRIYEILHRDCCVSHGTHKLHIQRQCWSYQCMGNDMNSGLEGMFYSQNARVCAKWKWNARDCVTYCGQTELRLSIEFDTTKLHVFQIRNLFHCIVESWWNMPFKGTRHGDGLVQGAVAMLLRLWKHAATLWHHAAWIRIVTSHNAWMGYDYSLLKRESPKGDS